MPRIRYTVRRMIARVALLAIGLAWTRLAYEAYLDPESKLMHAPPAGIWQRLGKTVEVTVIRPALQVSIALAVFVVVRYVWNTAYQFADRPKI